MKQQNLIDIKGILVLQMQDLATSNDPLEACLERAGYTIKKQSELKERIADKMTPDMFRGTTTLNAEEIAYQEVVDKCIIKLRGSC